MTDLPLRMHLLKILYLFVGLVLLVLVLSEVDIADVVARVRQVGWGFVAVLGIYLVAFLIDSFSWQLALLSVPISVRWLYRVWKVRMVGEMFNAVMPAAGMGGEPVKAVLLKKHYRVAYREATASLILAKTINMIALVVFLTAGFALMLASPELPGAHKAVAGFGLAACGMGTASLFLIQRLKISSLTGSWISRTRLGTPISQILHHLDDMDARLVTFYMRHGRRFIFAVSIAFVNWLLGVLEIFYATAFLGHPVSLTEAWIIEAVAQLVRFGTFYIPASIGAQEGAFLLILTAMTGSPGLGVAVAVVRRLRELVWIVWGFALGAIFTLRPPHSDSDHPLD